MEVKKPFQIPKDILTFWKKIRHWKVCDTTFWSKIRFEVIGIHHEDIFSYNLLCVLNLCESPVQAFL